MATQKQTLSIAEERLIESNTKLVEQNTLLKEDNTTLQEYVRFLEKVISTHEVKLKSEEKERMKFLRKGLYITKWTKRKGKYASKMEQL